MASERRRDDDDPTPAADPGPVTTSESTSSSSQETTSSSSSSEETTTSSEAPPPSGGEIPPATQSPDGLGTDPTFDEFAQQCFDGLMFSCDVLFISAPEGPYKAYGDSCAGRQPEGTDLLCTLAFPGE